MHKLALSSSCRRLVPSCSRPNHLDAFLRSRIDGSLRTFSSAAATAPAPTVTVLASVEPPSNNDRNSEKNLRPSEVVAELDRHIVGQADAKRAVAIAMRNRWRRKLLSEDLRKEVTPRNVLLVGPTGCGVRMNCIRNGMSVLSSAFFSRLTLL
jgi:hypothetical protein